MTQQSNLSQDIFGEQDRPEGNPGQPLKPSEGPSMLSMQPVERVWGRGRDALAALLLALICFLTLFFTLEDYGITWDEAAPNFVAARMQAQWFGSLGALDAPFSKETIDRYWSSPSTHPSLTRSLMALSLLAFEEALGEVRAMRLPSVLLASLLTAVMYYWLSRRLNSVAALGAVTIWLTLPRVFGHLHIASLDVPMMVWWALTAMAFHEGSERALISRWHVLTGLIYGLALSTKLHSFFLPIPLLIWMLVQRRWLAWRNLVAMAVLGPAVYLLTQVYLWHDFWPRLLERYITYSSKDSIAPVRIFYFGKQFMESTPWHYPLVMTLITTPWIILFFWVLGAIGLGRLEKKNGLRSLILLNILVPASLITLPHAQGYDGIRLILPAMPWLAMLGGIGLDRLVEGVRRLVAEGQGIGARLTLLVCFLVLSIPGWWTLRQHHPFHLEYYADWIGGYGGGLRLGMESTYWCDTLLGSQPVSPGADAPPPEPGRWDQRGLIDRLNRLPAGAKLKTLAMSEEVMAYYQSMGVLKPTLELNGQPPYDYHLLQCRQGFFGRTEWAFYKGQMGAPLAVISHEGVPFFMLFGPLSGR